MSPTTAYCTILARNYLPRALTLADSLRRHHPGSELVVLFIDVVRDAELPVLDGARAVSTEVLGLAEREVLQLAAGYDLVEFATAIKPLLFRALLEDADQVVYLDPDTYVTAPMEELTPALAASAGGIVLTPHYLEPVPDGAHGTEGHLLHVGVYNLGFCALDRRSRPFLDWWWGHLDDQCLHDPLSGLFVDQKWVDIGSVLFGASALAHRGYNVGIANIHERPISRDGDGYLASASGDRLRLFHFHSFDTSRPQELSTRSNESTAHLRAENPGLEALCREYAEQLVVHEAALPPRSAYTYPWGHDTRGRRLARQTRRVHRAQRSAGGDPPSPFLAAEADAYDAWRRSAWRLVAKDLLGDTAKAARCVLPDEFGRLKDRLPGVVARFRGRYVDGSGIWG